MSDIRKHSSTSNVLRFALKHATTGVGLTGLSSASSGLIISTIADNEATATAYTVAGSTIETIVTLGTYAAPTATKCRFKEVDATNHPGLYEFHFADARFAVASAKRLVVTVSGATNLLDTDYEVQLTSFDLDTANVTLAAATHTGAVIPTVTNLTNLPAITTGWLTAAGIAAGALNGKGDWGDATAANQTVIAAYVDELETRLTAARAGYLDNLNGHVAQTGDSFARLGAPAGASIAADIATVDSVADSVKAKTDNLTFTVANTLDSNVKAINDDTDAPSRLESGSKAILEVVIGTGSTTTELVFSTINGVTPSSDNDFYNDQVISFETGALAGQKTDITDYVGATKTATVPALTGAPANGDKATIS